MIDHIGLSISNLAKARAFYDAAFKPLGFAMVMEVTPQMTGSRFTGLGYGPVGSDIEGLQSGKPSFWISDEGKTQPRTHVAFVAGTRAQVDAFHAAALAAGGTDNGAPGVRPHYHANYYAAFVLDPDGHNIEAVCHKPA